MHCASVLWLWSGWFHQDVACTAPISGPRSQAAVKFGSFWTAWLQMSESCWSVGYFVCGKRRRLWVTFDPNFQRDIQVDIQSYLVRMGVWIPTHLLRRRLLGVPNIDPHQAWLEDCGCLGEGRFPAGFVRYSRLRWGRFRNLRVPPNPTHPPVRKALIRPYW